MHAPHQAPADYLEKYRGRFDDGWDVARDRWFARQLEMGLLPAGTELAPRNPGVEPWDTPAREPAAAGRPAPGGLRRLPRAHRRPDRPLRRRPRAPGPAGQHPLPPAVRQRGQPGGRPVRRHARDEVLQLSWSRPPTRRSSASTTSAGPHSHANYPWGWAQAGNTPFKWYKQNTHEGGVHVPLIVHWPDRIADAGGLRDQFHHVNDIVPTIYEILGIDRPRRLPGATSRSRCRGCPCATRFDAPDAPSQQGACSTSR